MFDELKKKSFAELEEEVLDYWQAEEIFQQSIKQRKDSPRFSFYDGPPFATGLPHYGHLLAGTIKDVVPRYKTMKGFYVSRRFGWDCHGLPVENEIEKSFDLSGAKAIEEFGIAKFNEACRDIVLRYSKEWESIVNRMGRWVDFSRTYRTMDPTFMESVWWVFKQLFNKGLVYEGYKVMPFSAKLGTPLSNFEATQNYREVDDPALTVQFPLIDEENTFLLVWTTTPWTLVSNLAATVGDHIDYVRVRQKSSGKIFILAEVRLQAFAKTLGDHEVLSICKGEKLLGLRYKPPFDYFADRAEHNAFQVLGGEFVNTDDGTGVVHCAPAFGEDDFYTCQEANIEPVCPVDSNGKFTDEIPEYAGKWVKDADKEIIRELKKRDLVFHQGTIRHRYPFCWRSDTPLIYKAVGSWFVSVEKVKHKLLKANEEIQWTPSHLKHGRFGKWLEGARDWAISRNRYWGTPIPLWRSDDGELHAIGSIAELEELSGQKIDDLHRHFIDDITFEKNGKTFRRISEVFDCWFESGSMPYAQNHYPFERKETFEQIFPADFIAEGLDQTRGWFYTLTVLAASLFDKPAFKNVIVNGIILAEDGAKMSKRLKNYPDPLEVVGKYGADAVRLYMLNSPAVRADDLAFKETGVALTSRQVLIPWWNAFSFFLTYARICEWDPSKHSEKAEAMIDRWILSKVQALVLAVEEGMDGYELSKAVDPFVGFIDQLTNWYIRRCRRRFWSEKDSADRRQAFTTLYHVLLELSKVAAPFVPFISDSIFRHLRSDDMPESVHLCSFPEYSKEHRDEELEAAMAAVQTAVSLGHSLRKDHKIRVRQPLRRVHLACADSERLRFLQSQQHLIADELNVKEVQVHATDEEFVSIGAKPNFRALGKKVGKLMKVVQAEIAKMPKKQLMELLDGKYVQIEVEGQSIELGPEEIEVTRTIKDGLLAGHDEGVTLVLETELDEELLVEGMSRELVHKINQLRREAGLDVSDRIKLSISTKSSRVLAAMQEFGDFVCGEVLADELFLGDCEGVEAELNGEEAVIAVEKIQSAIGTSSDA